MARFSSRIAGDLASLQFYLDGSELLCYERIDRMPHGSPGARTMSQMVARRRMLAGFVRIPRGAVAADGCCGVRYRSISGCRDVKEVPHRRQFCGEGDGTISRTMTTTT